MKARFAPRVKRGFTYASSYEFFHLRMDITSNRFTTSFEGQVRQFVGIVR